MAKYLTLISRSSSPDTTYYVTLFRNLVPKISKVCGVCNALMNWSLPTPLASGTSLHFSIVSSFSAVGSESKESAPEDDSQQDKDEDDYNHDRDEDNNDHTEEDKKELCPFCDDLLPAQPFSKLSKMKATLLAMPNICQGIGRMGAMSLPFSQTADLCTLHEARCVLIPLGVSKEQLTTINFEGLPTYQGYEIIVRTLESAFMNNSTFQAHLTLVKTHPLSPDLYLHQVLLPKITTCIIGEDVNLDQSNPVIQNTLEASHNFGSIVFPLPNDPMTNIKNAKGNKIAQTLVTNQIISLNQQSAAAQNSALQSPLEQEVLRQLP
ncbi:hypothetical protein DFH28DRAFT_1184437 [Melampsora americana]|nr:hypothetical protein DFH28DRAFT_1184437 [Melampsora americana]